MISITYIALLLLLHILGSEIWNICVQFVREGAVLHFTPQVLLIITALGITYSKIDIWFTFVLSTLRFPYAYISLMDIVNCVIFLSIMSSTFVGQFTNDKSERLRKHNQRRLSITKPGTIIRDHQIIIPHGTRSHGTSVQWLPILRRMNRLKNNNFTCFLYEMSRSMHNFVDRFLFTLTKIQFTNLCLVTNFWTLN